MINLLLLLTNYSLMFLRINRYKVASKDLGILKKVSVRHDNTGLGPAWYLEKVYIT